MNDIKEDIIKNAENGDFNSLKKLSERAFVLPEYYCIDIIIELILKYLNHKEFVFIPNNINMTAFIRLLFLHQDYPLDFKLCYLWYELYKYTDLKKNDGYNTVLQEKTEKFIQDGKKYIHIEDLISIKETYMRIFHYAPDDNKPFPKYKQLFDDFMKEIKDGRYLENN